MQWPIWETCLRSLSFHSLLPPDLPFELTDADEVFTQQEAYRFLLEVICGLHSPIVGETEVFGQFKNFAQEWVRREPLRAGLVQRVLTEVKALRARHLSGLGTQSYGSWLRKNLEVDAGEKIHLIGAGQLAREILPYLAKLGEVVVHVRSPQKVNLNSVCVRGLHERAFDHGALVVAAPMSKVEISNWLNDRVPARVFDLRDNSAREPVADHAVSLQDIFVQIESTRARLRPIVKKINAEIQSLAVSAAGTGMEKLRPHGWDDLCA